MKRLFTLALQGLATVLPVALTVYFVYWLLAKMETVVSKAILLVLPPELYFRGLGILSAFIILVAIGLLVRFYVVRYILRLGEALLGRIPLIKSIFGAIQDFTRMFSSKREHDAQSVVLVEVQEGRHLMGFVTGSAVAGKHFPEQQSGLVGVYLPMSYQIGGYTLYVTPDRLQTLDIPVEEAMRIALTGGIQNGRPDKRST
ncbi:DUF502 domain-containing protein [Parahaliea aestuarii]|uniref:DUF502 domain-containing protein n=1 Tax=Parahaliea aestuarii TaxID=1852021 RepID=A0A5C9A540_9GAMM|nr:DUF502 domain-containing protein [Parahaliea aestuarii]TXS95102.1 DUF502 domain-containing protein [Parahaliea aestuarii]